MLENFNMNKNPVIGIIGGTGKMGTFFRHLFEKDGLTVLIAGRSTPLTYQQLCQKSDIVIISVPFDKTNETIKSISKDLKSNSLLVNFSSIQEPGFFEMSKTGTPFLGIHPLFGPLVTSLEGQVFAFCKGKENHWGQFLKQYFESKNAKVIFLDPQEHDKQMALVQGLIHLSNILIGMTLKNSKIVSEISTPIFRLQTLILGRVFSQNSNLYENILMENQQFLKILESIENNFTQLKKLINNKNRDEFAKTFDEIKSSLGQFIKVAENKTANILNIIDKQPIKTHYALNPITNIKDLTIAFLGPSGTYSEQAANNSFPKAQNFLPAKTIGEVFDFVNSGKADFGVVPSENLIEGMVKETIASLIQFPLEICGEYVLPIHHCLLSFGKDKSNIEVIKSHPQALGQCRNYLKINFSNARIESQNSTVSAIETDHSPNTGFIASSQAAKLYNLSILDTNIGDNKNNQTEFFIVGHNKVSENPRKSILLLSAYDRVGVLRDILNIFADKDLNLSKISSIPSGDKAGEYLFFIEVNINKKYPEYQKALKDLEQYCQSIRILGEI